MFLQLKIRTREQLIPRFLPQTRWNPKQWFHHTADVYALHCCVKCKFYNPPSMYLRKNKWWAINARTFSDCSIVSCYCCETYESVFCSETPPVLLMKCKLLIKSSQEHRAGYGLGRRYFPSSLYVIRESQQIIGDPCILLAPWFPRSKTGWGVKGWILLIRQMYSKCL